jgi:hypothetical protein
MITLLLCIIIVILLMQSEGGRSCLGALVLVALACIAFVIISIGSVSP